MRYSWQHVSKNRKKKKKVEEYILPIVLFRKIAIFFDFIFLNMGLTPNFITLISFIFILLGGFLVFIDEVLWGTFFFLMFALFDCVDGEMARCIGRLSSYGHTLEEFGADLFYMISPFTLGIFLSRTNIEVSYILGESWIIVGALVSLLFLVYKSAKKKVNKLVVTFRGSKNKEETPAETKIETSQSNLLGKLLFYHDVAVGTFFTQIGNALIFFLLVLLGQYVLLAYYLIILLIYNVAICAVTYIEAYYAITHWNVFDNYFSSKEDVMRKGMK